MISMRHRLACLLWTVLLLTTVAPGASALDVPADMYGAGRRQAVPVEATVTDSPPSITVHFLDAADGLPYEVFRRLHGEVAWGTVATLAAGTSSWSDTTVSVGVRYEYRVVKTLDVDEVAVGWVASGVEVDRSGARGAVLVVVDDTLLLSLAPELERLLDDLAGDGWSPTLLPSPRGVGWDDPSGALALRQSIATLWSSLPPAERPTHLLLLGHLPVARSGLDATAPDGHDEHRGAHASDAFYADVDGVWTDLGTAPAGVRPDHANLPGDGRWDQDFLPSELEMACGRVDFFEATGQPGESEVDVLRRYLDRDHAYRHAAPGYAVGRRVLFANGYVESVEMAWRTFPGIVGADDTEFVQVAELDAAGGPVAWANTYGPYLIFAQNVGVPDIVVHRDQGTNALLWSSDQSWFGLWGEAYSRIRELLASPGINLAWVWEVSPSYVFSDLAMGDTLGEAVRRTAAHSLANPLFERPAQPYDEPSVWNRQFIALHGDPTLRLFVVPPPTELTVDSEGDGVRLDWIAAPSVDLVGYHVERGSSGRGPFVRLTTDPTPATTWLDAAPGAGPAFYRVRAVRRETTGGGTFLNPSQGLVGEWEPLFRDGFESGDASAWVATP